MAVTLLYLAAPGFVVPPAGPWLRPAIGVAPPPCGRLPPIAMAAFDYYTTLGVERGASAEIGRAHV